MFTFAYAVGELKGPEKTAWPRLHTLWEEKKKEENEDELSIVIVAWWLCWLLLSQIDRS